MPRRAKRPRPVVSGASRRCGPGVRRAAVSRASIRPSGIPAASARSTRFWPTPMRWPSMHCSNPTRHDARPNRRTHAPKDQWPGRNSCVATIPAVRSHRPPGGQEYPANAFSPYEPANGDDDAIRNDPRRNGRLDIRAVGHFVLSGQARRRRSSCTSPAARCRPSRSTAPIIRPSSRRPSPNGRRMRRTALCFR